MNTYHYNNSYCRHFVKFCTTNTDTLWRLCTAYVSCASQMFNRLLSAEFCGLYSYVCSPKTNFIVFWIIIFLNLKLTSNKNADRQVQLCFGHRFVHFGLLNTLFGLNFILTLFAHLLNSEWIWIKSKLLKHINQRSIRSNYYNMRQVNDISERQNEEISRFRRILPQVQYLLDR